MMKRREFIHTVGAGAVAWSLPRHVQGSPELVAGAQARTNPATGGLFVCIHQASTSRYDFKTSVEGIAKAGVRAVEVDIAKVQEFAKTESVAAAKRLMDDLGVRPVSSSNHLGFVDATEAQLQSGGASLDTLKGKLEIVQAIGCDRIVCPSTSTGNKTLDDYKRGAENLRAGGELAKSYGVTLMLEFTKTSTLAGTLPSALTLVRDANHPNVRMMLDTFHFWAGQSKFEDLELLRDGELAHLHFEDIPADPPREMLGSQQHRAFPGEGSAPLRRIIEVLKRNGYSGPASLEIFQSGTVAIQNMDPFQLATRAKAAIDPLIA
jgi:4-hydroxyphenylpyruvate dioxygenase